MVTILVPNGGAPEKVNYFNEDYHYENGFKFILSDNKGDDSNKEMFLREALTPTTDKILITSEDQLDYLSSMLLSSATVVDRNRANALINRCIYLKSNTYTVNGLVSKEVFTTLPNLGKDYMVVNRKEALKCINKNMLVKSLRSSGSRGVHMLTSRGNISSKKVLKENSYLIQPIYDVNEYAQFTVPVVIKNSRIVGFVPMTSINDDNFMSKWRNISICGIYNEVIEAAIQELVDYLNLTDGFMEPEFFVNTKNPDLSTTKLIDLNPRWSYDCSTCNSLMKREFSESFDLFKYYVDEIEFRVSSNLFTKLYRLSEIYV